MRFWTLTYLVRRSKVHLFLRPNVAPLTVLCDSVDLHLCIAYWAGNRLESEWYSGTSMEYLRKSRPRLFLWKTGPWGSSRKPSKQLVGKACTVSKALTVMYFSSRVAYTLSCPSWSFSRVSSSSKACFFAYMMRSCAGCSSK